MAMETYDFDKMRSAAGDITTELQTFKTARDKLNEIITTLKNNWKDDTSSKYTNKYETEAKVAAENVEKLMKQYANVLEAAVNKYEELQSKSQESIG